MGIAGRFQTDHSVSTFQLASTNLIALSYVRKVSEKVQPSWYWKIFNMWEEAEMKTDWETSMAP